MQFLLEDGDTGDAGGYGVHAIFERQEIRMGRRMEVWQPGVGFESRSNGAGEWEWEGDEDADGWG